jgi:hypothetical protein
MGRHAVRKITAYRNRKREVETMEHAEWKRGLLIAVSRPKEQAKGICRLTHAGMAAGAEDIGWTKRNWTAAQTGFRQRYRLCWKKALPAGRLRL